MAKILCSYCNSENVESTGITLYSFPSYSEYQCNNCNKTFEICNNETIPHIDLTKSVELPKKEIKNFINSIINEGVIMESVCFNDNYYILYKYLFGTFYYQDKDKNFVHINIKEEDIKQCFKLYKLWKDN